MRKILFTIILLTAVLFTPRPLWEGEVEGLPLLGMARGMSFAQQRGKATYYSKRATGARTASGVRLHHDSLVCAHRTYPFGTKLLVKNPANGKEVVVKVIDRGPFMKGGIIDLSYEAARRIGIISKGVAMVEVHVYKDKNDIPYRPEPDEIPELDIEITENFNGSTPAWRNSSNADIGKKATTSEKPNEQESVKGNTHEQAKDKANEQHRKRTKKE